MGHSLMNEMSYSIVTELPGSRASKEQVQRLVNRYQFAAGFCQDKDVLEIACGPGIGLGVLNSKARSLIAGDVDEELLAIARQTYPNQIDLRRIDAQELPFEENTLDVIILFEAIYYLEKPERFVQEARRVLRDNGTILVCNPNKDLPDFNPSPFSYRYFNAPEFRELFEPMGFEVTCCGDSPLEMSSRKSRAFSSLKRLAAKLHLIPKTMQGKVVLKRIVFGDLVVIPAKLSRETIDPVVPTPIPNDAPDLRHKVIFCAANLHKERAGYNG